MNRSIFRIGTIAIMLAYCGTCKMYALSSSDISITMLSGYFWMDNACTGGGPAGKVVSFRIRNTKGSTIKNLYVNLGAPVFTAAGSVTYTSGTPSYNCRTSNNIYIGNLASGDSATAFYYIGYNCLLYPNSTKITTDYITLPLTLSDNLSGTVNSNFQAYNYVLKNSSNNTISVLASSTNVMGGTATISVSYNISNVKPANIIDMELSSLNTFPAGYSITGCCITASNITSDFPLNARNTYYCANTVSNMSSGGNVTIEWYLKIESALTGISMAVLNPYIVSDAGADQRWQTNTTTFTSTATPVNAISISKRSNYKNVFAGDTVVYTIVLKNSSLSSDITIDKLVDILPRDYKFLHMEVNPSVFPRLITYSNCTAYPSYLSGGSLTFLGHAETSPGIYSWIVPANDSVKLVYSVHVSSVPASNDTNTVTAYTGDTNAGTAFSTINVLVPLPAGLQYFNAEVQEYFVNISWGTLEEQGCRGYLLQKQVPGTDNFVTISDIPAKGILDGEQHYNYDDRDITPGNLMVYKLISYDFNGQRISYFTSARTWGAANDNLIYRHGTHYLAVSSDIAIRNNMHVILCDISGKVLFDGLTVKENGNTIIPFDIASYSNSVIIVAVNCNSTWTAKRYFID